MAALRSKKLLFTFLAYLVTEADDVDEAMVQATTAWKNSKSRFGGNTQPNLTQLARRGLSADQAAADKAAADMKAAAETAADKTAADEKAAANAAADKAAAARAAAVAETEAAAKQPQTRQRQLSQPRPRGSSHGSRRLCGCCQGDRRRGGSKRAASDRRQLRR